MGFCDGLTGIAVKDDITTVIFDWDNTLVQVMGNAPTSHKIAALFQTGGLSYSPDDVEWAINRRQQLLEEGKLQGKRQVQTRREVTNYYRQLLRILGSEKNDPSFAYGLYEDFAYLPVELYGDSLPTLEALYDLGFHLGIISNNSVTARRAIELHVGAFIERDHIIISEELGVHKPAKTIFLRAIAALGVRAENCAYVGDNLEVDAIGAVQNGGYRLGVWIDRSEGTQQDLSFPQGVVRISSLAEVMKTIAEHEE